MDNLDLYIRLILSFMGVLGTGPLIIFFWKKRNDPYIRMFMFMKMAIFAVFMSQVVIYVLRIGNTIEASGWAAYVFLVLVNFGVWYQTLKLYLEKRKHSNGQKNCSK